jgi:hypothetical protein
VRLSGETEARDALQALASRRRELPLTLVTDRPLRKSKRMPRGERKRLQREVLEQISHQLKGRRRRAFRGHVAVDLELRLPAGRHGAGIAPVVKAYLDVLGESAFHDDSVIDHLIVSCSRSSGAGATARIRCHPVNLFAASFDRSFRVAPELGLHDPDAHASTQPWGLRGFDRYDEEALGYEEGVLAVIERLDAEEEQASEEDEDEDFYPEVGDSDRELADPQLRESLGPEMRRNIGHAFGRKLTDQGFDSRDRPGPPPGWLEEVIANDLGDVEHQSTAHPGCFTLPPPPERERRDGEPTWDLAVRKAFFARYGSPWEWGRALFGEPLALDIAVCGGAAPRHDLDNLAHRVTAAFSDVFRAATPSIGGYRVYRVLQDAAPEVRVRVVPRIRLQLLRDSLGRAEELILAERAERSRG